jgi:predicted AAA+ superfamily ATPase
MIKRTVSKKLAELASVFKAVALIGPRQSGKTTLVKELFGHKPYINLENPDSRIFAIDDPRGFLSQFPEGAILDEVQRTPYIFSYLQEILDTKKSADQFILTGSNNFLLQENITQSLAGRIAYVRLLPFSIEELFTKIDLPDETDLMFKGLYPPLYDTQIQAIDWYPNYIRTYIERDVRQLKNITDLLVFERFMRLLAARTGQEINFSSLSIEVGVDVKTVQSWVGILESSFIIFLLKPYYKNYNKTLIKRPKIYFYDTGIVCSLLGITEKNQLINHPLRGALFECFVISEMIKKRYNAGKEINLYFWRDKTGHEIDLIIDGSDQLVPIEIKSGKTVHSEFFKNLKYWQKISGIGHGRIIYAGDSDQKRSDGMEVVSWKELATPGFIS